jgi:hypothetical protein
VSDADAPVAHSWRDAASLGFGLAVSAWAGVFGLAEAFGVVGGGLFDHLPGQAVLVVGLATVACCTVVADRIYAAGFDVKHEVGESLVVAIPATAVVGWVPAAVRWGVPPVEVALAVAAIVGLAFGFRDRWLDGDVLGWE